MLLSSLLTIAGLFDATLGLPLQSRATANAVRDGYPLSGIVVDERNTPVISVELTISRDGATLGVLRSSKTGTFLFESAARGKVQVVARRLGYKPLIATIDLDSRPPTEVLRMVLETLPTTVAAVLVTSGNSRLDQFNDHRKHYAFGRFIDRAEIEKTNVRLASDLLRSIPGASLRASRRYGNTIRLRGCQPIVWVDRVPIREVELDEVAVPEEIAGIEIYTSSMTVPAQFMDRGGRSCGAIVVWTRIN